jgi:hypothetical protein
LRNSLDGSTLIRGRLEDTVPNTNRDLSNLFRNTGSIGMLSAQLPNVEQNNSLGLLKLHDRSHAEDKSIFDGCGHTVVEWDY